MQNTLLDILILGLLVLLFASVYRTRRALRLRYWIAGWVFVLAHFALMLPHPANSLSQSLMVGLTLVALLLGGVCFLLASARASNSAAAVRLPRQALLALPPVVYIFLAVFSARADLLLPAFLIAEAAVFSFVFYRWPHRPRVLASVILCGAAALAWTGWDLVAHQEIPGVYALLMQIYLTNAVVYWHGFHRWSMGVVTAAAGLVAWGLVFPTAVALAALAPGIHVSGELWNLPKYFVEFGMILTLVEDEVIETARQREEYRVLFDGNPHPMWISDPETLKFLKVNAAATNHYGYKQDEFLARTLRSIHQLEDVPRLEHRLRDAGEQTLYSGPWTHVRKDGSTIQVEVASHQIQFNGHPARFSLVQDVTERQQLYERLVHQAHHDMLTGLPNRLLLKDRMEQVLATAERQGQLAAILCLDLDSFKQVNDTYGHHAGDTCLQQVASSLRDRLRMMDTIARSGGEEFIVLLGQLRSPADAGNVARVLLDSFRQSLLIEGHAVHLTASIGIAIYPADGKAAQDLWRMADSAMYRAKRAGGNRYVFASSAKLPAGLAEFDHEMDVAVQNRPLERQTPGD